VDSEKQLPTATYFRCSREYWHEEVFMKIVLRWSYNNVGIKEGDEWKVAFTTPEGSFEPTVMFFRLTNLLMTF